MLPTYHSVLSELENSKEQLRPVDLPPQGRPTVTWLRARRELEVLAADAACEEFALNLRWPVMRTDSVTAQVHIRLLEAIAICRHLSHRSVPAGVTRRQILRSLLLEHWHQQTARVLQRPDHAAHDSVDPSPNWHSHGPWFNLTVAS